MVKKFEDMFSRFDIIPACDEQTGRQTDEQIAMLRRHSLCYAMEKCYKDSQIKAYNITKLTTELKSSDIGYYCCCFIFLVSVTQGRPRSFKIIPMSMACVKSY